MKFFGHGQVGGQCRIVRRGVSETPGPFSRRHLLSQRALLLSDSAQNFIPEWEGVVTLCEFVCNCRVSWGSKPRVTDDLELLHCNFLAYVSKACHVHPVGLPFYVTLVLCSQCTNTEWAMLSSTRVGVGLWFPGGGRMQRVGWV